MQGLTTNAGLLRAFSSHDIASNSTRLILTRWAAGVMVLLATVVCVHGLRLPLPEAPLYAVGLIILAYNAIVFYWQMRRIPPLTEADAETHIRRLVLVQVGLDWLSMTIFLHLTGGITSPAVSFFFIHVVIVTVMLPAYAPIYAALAIAMLGGLALLEAQGALPHYTVLPGVPADLHTNGFFVLAQIIFLGTGLVATVFIASGIMHRLRQRELHIAALLQTAQDVNSTLEMTPTLEHLARNAAEALAVRGASIRLLDATRENLNLVAFFGLSQSYLDKGPVSLRHSELDRRVLANQAVIICDPMQDRRLQYPQEIAAEGIQSMLVAPIISRHRPLGVLRVYSESQRCFTEEDAEFLTAIAQQGATAIENALAHEQLSEADQERAQFVRAVTHELRAPVTGAQSLMRVMLRGMAGDLSDQQKDILRRLEGRLDSLLALINDLLSFAASKAVDMHQPPHPTPLNAILGSIRERYALQAEEKGLVFKFDLPATPLTVRSNEDGLIRIFDNLVGNAIKYTPAPGHVTVRVAHDADNVIVTVADTGIGIPEDVLEHLGQEFFRAPNAKEAGISGTGLGLAIVRQLVDYFGGAFHVESKLNEGSTFTITLPLTTGPETASA